MADTTNLATLTKAAARDFVPGITSSKSGYKIFIGNTIGMVNKHIRIVINKGLLISHKATVPINIAIIMTKIIATLKHFAWPNLVSSFGLEKLTIANEPAIAP